MSTVNGRPADLLALLTPYALEGRTVLFLVHEAPIVGIALCPVSSLWVEYLRAVFHSAATGVVTGGIILGHGYLWVPYWLPVRLLR